MRILHGGRQQSKSGMRVLIFQKWVMGLRLRLRLTYRGDMENVHRYFRLSVALPSGYDLLIVSHEENRDISVYGVPRIVGIFL